MGGQVRITGKDRNLPKGLPHKKKLARLLCKPVLRESAEEILLCANSLVFVTRTALQTNLPMWQTFW
jgi:hypothetical protein